MLAAVRPITSIWTPSAISSFQRMCCEHTLVVAIHSYQEDFLLLFLCDTNTEEDVYIHPALQKEGHALPSITAYGLVSGQFNSVTSYLSPTTSFPDTQICFQENGSLSSSQTVSSSENGETNFSSVNVDSVVNIPALEFINVPDINTNGKVNPSEALQPKDPLCCSEWDQERTAEDETDKTKLEPDVKTEDESKPETVSTPPPVQAAVSDPQMCVSPTEPKPVSNTCTSPHTPEPIHINSSYPGVPVNPVQPQLSHFMMHMFGSPVQLGPGPNTPFQHHTSPLALRPAAHLSAGANILHWHSNHIA